MSQSTSQFFDYSGITFNRNAIMVVSGSTIDEAQPGHLPFFRVVLSDNVEWNITAESEDELMSKRAAFITALNS